MSARTLTLVSEISPELQGYLEKLSKLEGDLPGELVDSFLSLLQVPDQLIRLDCDFGSTCRAGECRVVLQPSDRLREFMSTLARDFLD